MKLSDQPNGPSGKEMIPVLKGNGKYHYRQRKKCLATSQACENHKENPIFRPEQQLDVHGEKANI